VTQLGSVFIYSFALAALFLPVVAGGFIYWDLIKRARSAVR
jgi:hypothetical protein